MDNGYWKYTEHNDNENIDNDEWKTIIIDGKYIDYEVSDHGRIRRKNGRILKGNKVSGYYQVTIYVDNTKRTFSLHRLVTSAFIKNIHNKKVVNRIGKNKLNNNVNNLEWTTHSENIIHSSGRKIEQYDMKGNYIKEYSSIVSAANEYGISNSAISQNLLGQTKSSYGFIWKYCNDQRK